MQKIISLLLCLLLVGLLLSGCGAKTPDAGTGNFRVVTTIFPVYDFVRAVAGDSGKADITLLLRAGAEIHSYDPSPKDIIAIQEADLFI